MGSLSTCLPRLRPQCHLSQKYPWHFHRLSSCNFLIKRVRYMDTLLLPWFSATLDFVASAIKVSPVALCVTVSKTLIFATVISLFGEWFRELFLQFILRPCPVTIFGWRVCHCCLTLYEEHDSWFPSALLLALKTPAAIFNLLHRHIFAVMAISRCLSTFSKPLVIFCVMLFNIIVLVYICSFLFQYSVSSLCGIILGDQHWRKKKGS